jgi:hypothetical protein
MNKLRVAIVAVVLAGIAAIVVVPYRANVRLRADNDLLQRQTGQLAQLTAEIERLSNQLASASSAPSATKEEGSELLKLRNEVSQLRRQTNELARPRQETSRARPALDVPEVTPQNIFPKEAWAPVGLATPQASLVTWHWAMANGDLTTLSNCFSEMDQTRLAKMLEGMPAATMADRMKDITGYRIIGQSNYPNGQVELGLYYDGRGIVRSIRFEPVGNDWKLAPGQR